jgi:hypothetical protein
VAHLDAFKLLCSAALGHTIEHVFDETGVRLTDVRQVSFAPTAATGFELGFELGSSTAGEMPP